MTTATDSLSTDHSKAVADGSHSHGVGPLPEASRASRPTSFEVVDFPFVAVTPITARPSRSAIHSAVGVVVRRPRSSGR